MQNKDFQIHIPKPCHADWDKMSPNEQGKFCSLCDKTVVDFTQMNEQEIKNYFIQKTEERVCGHFRASQVVVPKPRFHHFLINTYQTIESKVSFYFLRQPALFMLGGFMFLVGCESRKTKGEATVEGKSKISAKDSLNRDSITYSRTTGTPMIQKDVELIPNKKSKGVIIENDRLINGEGVKVKDGPIIFEPENIIPYDSNKFKNTELLIEGKVKIKHDTINYEQNIIGKVADKEAGSLIKRIPGKKGFFNRIFKKEE
jgi:hypothetical protein